MRLIDADKLKKHYSWWNNENKEIFDAIVDMQPTIDSGSDVPDALVDWLKFAEMMEQRVDKAIKQRDEMEELMLRYQHDYQAALKKLEEEEK